MRRWSTVELDTVAHKKWCDTRVFCWKGKWKYIGGQVFSHQHLPSLLPSTHGQISQWDHTYNAIVEVAYVVETSVDKFCDHIRISL